MKQSGIFTYILVLLLCISACSSKIEVNSELRLAEELMDTAYDSSLYILQNLQDTEQDMTEGETALFNLLLFQACDKNTISSPPIELIDYSIEYFTATNDKKRLSRAYLYKSREFKFKREYADATQNLLKAREIAGPENDYDILGKVYFDLGQISGYQDETDKALEYYWKAAACFGEARQKENVARAYMVIGTIYMVKDMHEDAIFYANQTLKYTSDSVIMGDALHDIGISHYYNNNPDSALLYISQSILYPYFDTNMAMRYYNLANVYSYLEKYDSALFYVNKAFDYPIDIYFEEECYRILIKIALVQGDSDNAAQYVKRRDECKDSISVLEQQPKVTVIEQLHQHNKDKLKMKGRLSLLIIIITCLLVFGGLIFWILYKRNKQKQRKADMYKAELEKKEELLEEKEELLEQKDELLEKKDELLDKKHELLLQNFLNELKQIKVKYATARKNANFTEREQIDKKIYSEVFCFDNEDVFIEKMNKALNHLPDRLKADYPNISYKEIIWCCLFMLEIPTTDISLILDYKQSSLYKFKQRLGKKLDLNSLKDFEQMLQDKMDI